MIRMLRISLGFAFLLCGLLSGVERVRAQEPATIDSEPAVRFQQSSGYYNYAAFCRTPKDYSAQLPKNGLPLDQIEFGIGWYVKASVTHAGGVSPEIDGRIVVSPHHVRFMPADPQNAGHYVDIPRNEAELQHSRGEPGGSLRGKDAVVRFELRKICLTCGSGAAAPAEGNGALLDQEFALLNDTISHFESGWRTTYRMSKGEPAAMPSGSQPASVAASAPQRPSPETRRPADSASGASPAVSFAPPAAASKPVAANPNPVASAAAHAPVSAPGMGMPSGRLVKIGAGAADGLLVRKVPPSYPLEAKLVRLEGTVVLHAVIDRAGEVSQVNALSGPPLLESAAVDAVKQWQYRPYAVNGQAVDVETTIQVVFALDGNRPTTRPQNARARQ